MTGLVLFLIMVVFAILAAGGWLVRASILQQKNEAEKWEVNPKPKIDQIPVPKLEPKPVPPPIPAAPKPESKVESETSQDLKKKEPKPVTRPTGLGIPIGFGTSSIKEGKRIGTHLHYKGKHSLLLCGPSRLDKSRDFITPVLLDHDASMVVIDPKGEFAVVTARRRREMGHEVYILNPFGVLQNNLNVRGFPYASAYNPLSEIAVDSPNFMISILQLTDALVWDMGGMPKWSNEIRDFVAICLMWICSAEPVEKRNLNELYDIVMREPADIESWVKRVIRDGFPALSKLAGRFKSFTGSNAGLLVNLRSQISWLGNSSIKAVLSSSDFSLAELKQKKMTVYLILPEKHLSSMARWLRLLILTGVNINMMNDAPSLKPVLFLLTEFIVLNKIPSIDHWLSSALEQSIQFYISVQSMHQLKTIYKEHWVLFSESAGVSIFLAPNDMFTAEYISKRSNMKNNDKNNGGEKPKLTPIKANDVMQIADYKAIMFKHAQNNPIIIRRMDYREIKEYQGLFDSNPSLPAMDG